MNCLKTSKKMYSIVKNHEEIWKLLYDNYLKYGISKPTLLKSKADQVRDAIDAIHYEHRYDAGAMIGVLNAAEAETEYKKLQELLDVIPELGDEEREILKREISEKIKKIPEVEAEKDAEYNAALAKTRAREAQPSQRGFVAALKKLFRR